MYAHDYMEGETLVIDTDFHGWFYMKNEIAKCEIRQQFVYSSCMADGKGRRGGRMSVGGAQRKSKYQMKTI